MEGVGVWLPALGRGQGAPCRLCCSSEEALLDWSNAARGLAELLLLERASALRADQQPFSSQLLLPFTTSERAAVRERAVGRIGRLSNLLANYSSLEVRSQAPSSHPFAPSLPSRAACSLGALLREAWAEVKAVSKALA